MKFRLLIVLPFVLGFVSLTGIWLIIAEGRETAVSAKTPVLPDQTLINQLGGVVRAIAVSGDYAYIGAGKRLEVINIHDPDHPIVIGQTEELTATFNQLHLIGHYALAPVSYGLFVFDLSDPTKPEMAISYPIRAIAFSRKMLYV